jgi:7,8-dihydropterin-6-yl-methyl-4-(beta-D-ribofuranosyl)aminobenzene 5'-phosphate synthase
MTIPLQPVDAVEVCILVDNQIDLLLRSQPLVQRASLAGSAVRVDAPLFLDPHLPEMLVAEHGFSALVTVTTGGRTRRLMFDGGLSTHGLVHNLDALQIDARDIEGIVMSHGHFDHVGGLNGLIARLGARRMPLMLHPDFWLRRRIAVPNATPFELPTASRAAIEGAGFEVIDDRQPSLLLDGSVLITGEVDRTTEFERGFPPHQAQRNGEWTPDPLILDDQALIVNVRDRGLVVLTGCGHSGAVNIVRHAQKLTGEARLHALIGGFHLSGPLFAASIQPTIDALAELSPTMVVPSHCTGFDATRAISLAMPDAFVQGSVGTRLVL